MDPDRYLPLLAKNLNDLGVLEQNQNRMDDARTHYEEALQIQSSLPKQDPNSLPGTAMMLHNLAGLEVVQNRPDDARKHLESAIAIYRRLAEREPERYAVNLAANLRDLAVLERSQHNTDEARTHFQQALTLFRSIVQSDPRFARTVTEIETSLKALDGGPGSRGPRSGLR